MASTQKAADEGNVAPAASDAQPTRGDDSRSSLKPESNRGAVLAELAAAVLASDQESARRIFYEKISPNPAFSNGEVMRIAIKVGAFDEGERDLLERDDL